jgi:pimeloyl-ACP methyl ester carboxylesterase
MAPDTASDREDEPGESTPEWPAPDGWRAGVLHANDIDVSYYRVGDPDDPTVVCTHGFYEDARCMRPVVDALAATDRDVVAYDARGHGHTDAPQSGYVLDDRVADLVAVLDALGLDAPVLYGHSMGGGTVAATTAQHGDRVRAAVLEDPSSLRGTPDADPDDIAAVVRDQIADAHDQSHHERVAEHADEYAEDAEWFARASACLDQNLAAQGREPPALVDDHLANADVPTLLLRRDVDEDERDLDRAIVAGLDHVDLTYVPDSDHHVVHSRPAIALDAVRAFLDDRD